MPDPEKPAEGTATPETKPADITRKGLSRLGYALAAEPKPEEKPADVTPTTTTEEPAKPTEEKPAEAAAPATTTEDGQPAAAGAAPADPAKEEPAPPVAPEKRVKKVAAAPAPQPGLTREDLIAAVREVVKPTPATPAASPAAPEAPTLQPPDQEELELLRYAAEVEPEKYKDLPDRYVAFVRARDAFVEKQVRENGSFDPQSEEFREFLERNRPGLQRGERRKIEVRQIEDRATERARKDFEAREQKIMREVRAIKAEPVIRQAATDVIDRVLSIDDPVVKAFKEDPKKAVEENPLEAPEVAAAVRDTSALTEAYLRIANGLEDPDFKNPVHDHLDTFIAKQGELLDAKPEGERIMGDGKILISPAAYAKMVQEKNPLAQRYTTFTDQHVVTMLEEGARLRISSRLKQVRTNLERAGYKRQAPAPATPQKPTGEAAAAAAATPAPTPSKPAPQAVASSKGAPPPPGKTESSAGKGRGLKALGFS